MNELIDFREGMHFSIEIVCSIAKNFRSKSSQANREM